MAVAGGIAAGAAKLRVGLVLQGPVVGRSSVFEHGAFVGLQRAVRELGIGAKAVAPNPRDPGFLPSFSYLARQKYDLIVGVGFLESADIASAARRFPAARFAILDARWAELKGRPKNVRGTWFRTEQAGYLAGYLAALLERRRPGKDVVATVGGFAIPTVDAYIAGFQAGARKAEPAITTLNGYAQNFVNPARCKAVALSQIAEGAGVVFAVAGGCGLGALDAAKEKGVWGIGVDIDQSYLGPHILTSVVKRLDVAVFDLVRTLVEGTFRTGRDASFDLRNGGVALGKISSKVPGSLLEQVETIRKQIVAGKIKVPSTLGP